jgi:SAM-dependent methyltransferase
MTVGFRGDVAEYYAQYRRGYPPQTIDALQGLFGLTEDDVLLDVGCGTGQLAVPFAERVRAVVGLDPEPDMLRLARVAAAEQNARNVTWLLGADTDVPALGRLLGEGVLGAAVLGQAVHWMRHEELFRVLRRLVRPDGGVAVLANGTPVWLQDNEWSRALRAFLERYFGQRLENTCGTADHDRRRYARALQDAGFTEVRELSTEYEDRLTVEQLVGSLYSAFPADDLPAPAERPAFAEQVRAALPEGAYLPETVRVSVVAGRVPGGLPAAASE